MTYDGLVEKKVFEHPGPYKTVGGRVIKEVRFGYETIGQLNAAGDNAILIPHPNTGTSHFAGRYKREDPLPGYWDTLVGPGKPLDTDKYFLIGVDTLCNANVKDGITVATGPSSIDPDTGKPYGMRFPQVQIRDFVHVQKALLDHLGVKKLHAVMGASMGSMQTYDWAAAYPEMVERIICVVPSAFADAYLLPKLREFRKVIMLDPKWNNGDYYDGPEPIDGLTNALRLMFSYALTPEWGEANFSRKWADPTKDPAQDMDYTYAVNHWLDTLTVRAKVIDANHFMYIQRANELFSVDGKDTLEEGLKAIKAAALLIPSKVDSLLPPIFTRKTRDLLRAQGNYVLYRELDGAVDHYDGIYNISQANDYIVKFLSEPPRPIEQGSGGVVTHAPRGLDRWTGLTVEPWQNLAVVDQIVKTSKNPTLGVRVWSLCLSSMNGETGEIARPKEDLAKRLNASVDDVAAILKELVEMGALNLMPGPLLAIYRVNPRIATNLPDGLREMAQKQAPELKRG